MKENGVNISRRHERNDADSRDIVCVIFNRDRVENFKFEIKGVKRICNLFLHCNTGNLLWQIICQRI